MNKKEQLEYFDMMASVLKDILAEKGDDYANEDRLSNFKTSGAICGMSAAKHCLGQIATKVARLGNLLDGKSPKNEPVIDSIRDLANYTFLLGMIVEEEK